MTTKIALPAEDLRRVSWIAMSLAPGFGPQTFRAWLEEHRESPQAPEELARMAEEIFAECGRREIRVLTWDDPDYPAQLRGSRAAQPVLYMQGCWGPDRAVAMVGTRRASWNGKAVARALVEAMQGLCVSVVSGLAEGIDLACHRAALEFGLHTVAVLAHGLDQPLVGERGVVAQKILASGGALLTPFPPGTKAYKGNFLARNGIIAGISDATVVIECKEQSGALNTAEHCLADNRKLLAVPGDILRGSAQGPNMLIESQEASALWLPIQLPILCQLDPIPGLKEQSSSKDFQAFAGECCSLEEICERTGKSTASVLEALSFAELDGRVQSMPDGRYSFS